MNLQSDLFGEPLAAIKAPAEILAPAVPAVRVLAMPCGFLNSRNEPCHRRANRSVMIDGSPLICRGVSMLHCEPNCFRTQASPSRSYDENDVSTSNAEMLLVTLDGPK